jgi:hypothetical protein
MSNIKVGQHINILDDQYIVVGFQSRPGQRNKRNTNGLPNGSLIILKPKAGGFKRYPLEVEKMQALLQEGLISVS